MEEIYKPEHTDSIETYSPDNRQDILGDLPGWLIYTGSYIVYGLIALLVIGSAVFRYPEVTEQTIQIGEPGSVEWVIAPHSGLIDRFFAENGAKVKAGDTLAMFRSTASLADVKTFCAVLTDVENYRHTGNADCLRAYPVNLIMGEMGPAYGQLTQAVENCLMHHDSDLFSQRKKFLDEELRLLERNGEANKMDGLRVRRELFELKAGHEMEQKKNVQMLELAYENMVNRLKSWDDRHLIKCKSGGTLTWRERWSTTERVAEGDTLCTVLSEQRGTPTGHIQLNETQVSEISVGDKVSIALYKYPPHTYGKLIGEVASVSFVPHNNLYEAEVAFPEGLVTSNGQEIDCGIGLSGRAEIVTSDKTVISRIFEPVRQIINELY